MDYLFHLAMALVDAVALAFLARRPSGLRLLAGLAAVLTGTWLAATVLGRHVVGSGFAFFRFLVFGIALHLPVFSGASAWIFWRQRRRWLAIGPAVLALAFGGAGVDAFFVEPVWLEVSRHTLTSAKLERPLRIVVLADYQTDRLGSYERSVWRTADEQGADLVLLPGDYLQAHDREGYGPLMEATREYLREIRFGASARLGAYAVGGDIEAWNPRWNELFDGTAVTTLTGTRTLELPDLTLTALSLADTRSRTLSVPASPRFHVSFGHAPDYALLGLDVDLQIAGHTHGGQLRVPGIGPLMTFSRVPRSWAAGVTDLGAGRTLVVSRGIGMERGRAPRLRFLCRPEIVVLDVEPAR